MCVVIYVYVFFVYIYIYIHTYPELRDPNKKPPGTRQGTPEVKSSKDSCAEWVTHFHMIILGERIRMAIENRCFRMFSMRFV